MASWTCDSVLLMMVREIRPLNSTCATVSVPGSKSLTNRALVCAALAKGESRLLNASDSEDTELMMNGLNQLGVLARRVDDTLVVNGTGGRLFAPRFPVPVKNAGTTLRFLLSVAALAEGEVAFEGDFRMGERPQEDLLAALRSLGVAAQAHGRLPRYTVRGGGLRGGELHIGADKTSQFVSALLMVAPFAREDISVEIEGPLASSPYVEMTVDTMRHFGGDVEHKDKTHYKVRAGHHYRPAQYDVEPDASAAAYFFAAAAIASGTVVVKGIRQSMKQKDVKFLDVLRRMGCRVEETPDSVKVRAAEQLKGIEVDMISMPDVVPTLVATALFAEGPTRVTNIGHLRYKESDRLEALSTELRKLGAEVVVTHDSLKVEPAKLHGAQLDTYDDHRLAMSFALIGLRVPGVKVENPECVRKSFPGFWHEFEKLYQSQPRA